MDLDVFANEVKYLRNKVREQDNSINELKELIFERKKEKIIKALKQDGLTFFEAIASGSDKVRCKDSESYPLWMKSYTKDTEKLCFTRREIMSNNWEVVNE